MIVKPKRNNQRFATANAQKNYTIVVTTLAVLSILAFSFIFIRAGYFAKLLVKLGLKEPSISTNYTLTSWENCLQKLNYDADVVFLGDSITQESDFADIFPTVKVVNLGFGGDVLKGMYVRAPIMESLTPEKVFVMGGINNLTNENVDQSVKEYSDLIEKIQEILPNATLYIQSVLPIAKEQEKTKSNETIRLFNKHLEQLAIKHGATYIDLYTLYLLNGELNPALTNDGIHLRPEAYTIWANAIRKYIQE